MDTYAIYLHEVAQTDRAQGCPPPPSPTGYEGVILLDGAEVYRSRPCHNPLQAVAMALAWPDDPSPALSDAEITSWIDAAFGGEPVKVI